MWIACLEPLKTLPGESAPRHVSGSFRPTTVYALSIQSGGLTELFRSAGFTSISAAPVGNRVVFVSNDQSRKDEAVLYQGTHRVVKLSIDPRYFVWSTDAKRIFFYGGQTTEANAWNILGILSLLDFSVSKRQLLEVTEQVFTCAATGHVFTGFVDYENGLKPMLAVDYDSDVSHPQRLEKFPPGHFSANCKYVATTESYHGPVPWGSSMYPLVRSCCRLT